MTITAIIKGKDTDVYLSDVLVSRPSEGETLAFPGPSGTIIADGTSALQPRRLEQKLAIVNGHTVFQYAGSVVIAKGVFSEVERCTSSGELLGALPRILQGS